ncbi:hypothetical protein R6258_16445 [Halomonas sp. HP20-15]|uniref:hypothetical protein n=1 Tax=Halomonas sp. HP20-15 TaxID=3085901 RepID=UPI002981D6A0|nr:hypothetical protein [Halomonas sp. HP20-15]MDW5378510.1 hypothetical protein [Halomonas sp. HP20-15]
MTTQTSSLSSAARASLLKRIGVKAYRLLDSMTESAYRGFLAQSAGRYGID